MKIPKSECLNCKDRYVGCHSKCERYKRYREQVEAYHYSLKYERGMEDCATTRPWLKKRR